MTHQTFQFTVEEIFYIKPPTDIVILVGTVKNGTVRPGDTATVNCKSGPVSVVVDGIEGYRQGDLIQANEGQQVGLRVRGITKDQPSKGDHVVGSSGG